MITVKSPLRLTIGTKLVGLIGILLISSVVSLVWLSTQMFIQGNTALIQQTNLDKASALSKQTRQMLQNLAEKSRVFGSVLMQKQGSSTVKVRLTHEYFEKDKNYLGVFVYKHTGNKGDTLLSKAVSSQMKKHNDATAKKAIESITTLDEKRFSFSQLKKGEVQIATLKLTDGYPVVAVGIPFIASTENSSEFSHTLLTLIDQKLFVKAFSDSEIVTSYLIDRKGTLIAHPITERVGESVTYLDIVQKMLEGKTPNMQKEFYDSQEKTEKLGAFTVVGFGGLGVVTEVEKAKAYEVPKRVLYRSMLIAVIVLCISFLLGYFYSGTITNPIKLLVLAARKISEGDFNINLSPKGQDEVAHLSVAFNDMAKGLEERDKVKSTFNKFHNKEVAEKLLSGEVALGGERKKGIVFFSDVRGFTGLSESMTPEEVVEMLNEYMTAMVAVIRNYGGVVDKYVGDAIMALWGVPLGHEHDVQNALLACLGMRQALADLNEVRIARGQVPLKIGMGLNTGFVVAGNIGSDEKMEYTVIGDTVNLASRIEAMTKAYGTDLLISKAVYEEVSHQFICEPCKKAMAKGKSEAIEIFKVNGYYDADGNEVIIETPYSSYTAEGADKIKVLDEDGNSEKPPEVTANPSSLGSPENTPPPMEEAQPVDGGTMIMPETSSPAMMVDRTQDNIDVAEWFLKVEEEYFGPFTVEELCDGIESGEIQTTMMVSNSKEGPWTSLAEVPELKELIAALSKGGEAA